QPEVLLSYMHVSVEHLLERIHATLPIENLPVYDSMASFAQYFKEIIGWT
ncbi:uncharacterized protein METZ01_LOCUS470398, partial [marine metagenome]